MAAVLNLVNKFNSCNTKSIIHIKDLDDSVKYPIVQAKRVTTKYGTTIQVELENYIMFLPNRYNVLTDEEVKELSNQKFQIQRKGERNLILDAEMDDFFTQNAQYPTWE